MVYGIRLRGTRRRAAHGCPQLEVNGFSGMPPDTSTVPLRYFRIAIRTGAYEPRAVAMSGPRYGGCGRSKCRIRNGSLIDEGHNRFKHAPRQTSACPHWATSLDASPPASARPMGPGGLRPVHEGLWP